MFDTLIIFLKKNSKKDYFEEKKSAGDQMHDKLPNMQGVKSKNSISCGRLDMSGFVCGTMSRAKSLLHWSVIF